MNNANGYIPEKYWEKRLKGDFTLTGVGFSGLGFEYNTWLYNARLHALKGILKEMNIDCTGKTLLDIGVGIGYYIDFWEKQNIKNITGIDITSKAVEELQKKYISHKFVKADITKTELPFGSKFDIITAFDIFFHIVNEDDFEQAIKNLKKLSCNDTIILIMDCFLEKDKKTFINENYRTLSYYKKILNSNSISIFKVNPIFYLMSTPVDIDRISNKFSKILIKMICRLNFTIIYYLTKAGMAGRLLIYLWASIIYFIDRGLIKCTASGLSTKLLVAKSI